MSKAGTCVAPGCGAETKSELHHVCSSCRKRVENAMVNARPQLMEAMVAERAEVEAWLPASWAPSRRWVVMDEEHHEQPLDDVVKRMVEETASEWGPPFLGFVDDGLAQRREWRRQRFEPDGQPRPVSGWVIPEDSQTAQAWKAHLAPLVRAALAEALTTFPMEHAGREIKEAITQQYDYGKDQAKGGFEELWEGTGPTGLSDAAEDYLELLHYPNETWMCDIDFEVSLWRRHRVLSDEIMAIIDAYESAESEAA